jgi:pyridoxal phosphate enzyme (YggS family)
MSVDKRILVLMQRVAVACELNGRDLQDMRVLLATKDQPAEVVRQAVKAGLHLCGENKVQDLVKKAKEMANDDVVWHYIGHLQTNKVKDCLSVATCIQSVDRIPLVEELGRHCQNLNQHIDEMVEVNTSGEESKFGCKPTEVDSILESIQSKSRIHIRGFMTIGALSTDEATVRKCFNMLRTIRDSAITRGMIPSTAFELSMGMSHDLDWAIAEGSTMIRVGSAVFGNRT